MEASNKSISVKQISESYLFQYENNSIFVIVVKGVHNQVLP